MGGLVGIVIAGIGAVAAITGSFFTASATADTRTGEVEKQVVEVKATQSAQYVELKGLIERGNQDVREVRDLLRAKK